MCDVLLQGLPGLDSICLCAPNYCFVSFSEKQFIFVKHWFIFVCEWCSSFKFRHASNMFCTHHR